MAGIAALVLPARRAEAFESLRASFVGALGRSPGQHVEAKTYRGEKAVCLLLRQGPDPLNGETQPVETGRHATVCCGYYLGPDDQARRAAGIVGDNSTQRLQTALTNKGTQGLADGDGVYAFACWDSEAEHLTAGVDKLGMRPLYWRALPGGGYALASELKALLVLAPMPATNWAAWEEQLTFGFLFGDHTPFEGIERFSVAEAIQFDDKRLTRSRSEDLLAGIDIRDRPLGEFVEEQHAVFDNTMRRLCGLYDAPGSSMLTLSGGHDSRRMLAWLLTHDIRPNAFTVPEVRPDGSEYESAIVAQLCRDAGIEGYAVYPSSVADRVAVGDARDLASDFQSDEHCFSVTLAMAVAPGGRVNFDGLAAGSQLSGSFVNPRLFQDGANEVFLASLPCSVRRWLSIPPSDAPPLAERVRQQLERWGDHPNRFAYFYLLSRTRREIALAPLSIQANVFESLCPFLDRAMMLSALSFPPEHKIGAGLQGRLADKQCPMLAHVPTIYSKGVAEDRRYATQMGAIEQGARRETLKRASTLQLRDAGFPKGSRQRWRFQAARMMAALGRGQSRLRWEQSKAEKLSQLGHFEQVTGSTARYLAAADQVAAQYGSRADWSRSLQDPGRRLCS
ncbi:hypothetical protein SADO_15609 [Salinisphaera dokdonensis CL-ES53]|uniref:asparagine synthase (glutamine-hydrolyzing) n=1 Tax=Salinisphaera dokdonensis CL-ES53 TaxID=1304272 RepID=A0ABV2B4A6_9GAMM